MQFTTFHSVFETSQSGAFVDVSGGRGPYTAMQLPREVWLMGYPATEVSQSQYLAGVHPPCTTEVNTWFAYAPERHDHVWPEVACPSMRNPTCPLPAYGVRNWFTCAVIVSRMMLYSIVALALRTPARKYVPAGLTDV